VKEIPIEEIPMDLLQRALVCVTDLDFHETEDDRVRIIAAEIRDAENRGARCIIQQAVAIVGQRIGYTEGERVIDAIRALGPRS